MNKKGNILDWFFIMTILFLVALTLIAATIIVDKTAEIEVFSDNEDASHAIQSARSTLLSLDTLMLFIVVGLSIYVLVTSAIVYNHPGFFWMGILLLFIAITVSASLSNTFWTFRTSEAIAATANLYPKLTYLMENIPFYILFMGIAATIAMYVSYKQQ